MVWFLEQIGPTLAAASLLLLWLILIYHEPTWEEVRYGPQVHPGSWLLWAFWWGEGR